MFKKLLLLLLTISFLSSCYVKEEIGTEEFSALSCDEKVDYIIKRNDNINSQNWYYEGYGSMDLAKIKMVGLEKPNENLTFFKIVDLDSKDKAMLLPTLSQVLFKIKTTKDISNQSIYYCIELESNRRCYQGKIKFPFYANSLVGLAVFKKESIDSYKCDGNKVNIKIKDFNLTYDNYYLTEIKSNGYDEKIIYKDNKPYKIISSFTSEFAEKYFEIPKINFPKDLGTSTETTIITKLEKIDKSQVPAIEKELEKRL